MATLSELCGRGTLIRFDAALNQRELEHRRIFLLPKVKEWIETELPDLESSWATENTPIEQLDAVLHQFCAGKPMGHGTQYKKLHPRGKHVWTLKTGDLRIFGWFAEIDTFVVCAIYDATRVKSLNLYRGLLDEVARVRDETPLDEPKCIEGDEYDDVISNCR